MIMQSYRVSCEEFEGPLDLLLYLVRKQEVAIRDISLSRITREYLLFIKRLEKIDFDGAGEFLRYAATLLAIKAGEMSDEESLPDDEEYETKEAFIQRLEEYKKFKEKGYWFRSALDVANTMYPRPTYEFKKEVNVSLNTLKEILESIKKEKPFEPPTTILFHVEYLIEKLLEQLRKFKHFIFSQVVKSSEHFEVVGTFFALLEIIKQGKARAIQKQPFGEIWVKKR
ncbi:segregation/condensation protein A [candidate division WOR-3 bacterium]|nr:segregation/condensation protein A [candidate division WOR-3 bacterium]